MLAKSDVCRVLLHELLFDLTTLYVIVYLRLLHIHLVCICRRIYRPSLFVFVVVYFQFVTLRCAMT